MRYLLALVALALVTNCRSSYHGPSSGESSDDATETTSDAEGTTHGNDVSDGETAETEGTGEGTLDMADPVNWAIEMNGDQVAQTPVSTVTTLGDAFTVELWIRTGPDTTGFLFDTRTVMCCPTGWILYQDGGAWTPTKDLVTFIDYGAPDNMTWNYVYGPDLSILSPGWHHLAVVGSVDGKVRIFVDGSPGADDDFQPRAQPPGPLRMGWSPNGDLPLVDAAVDDLRISSIARYVEPFVPDEHLGVDASTTALWTFDEGGGSTSVDLVGGVVFDLEGTIWVER